MACGFRKGETLRAYNGLGVLSEPPERYLSGHAHFRRSIERVESSLRSKNVFLYIFGRKKKTKTNTGMGHVHVYGYTFIRVRYIYAQTSITIIIIIEAGVDDTFSAGKQFVTSAA